MSVSQELERETRRLSYKGRGGRAPPEALAWNDAAWEVPWHNMVGEVHSIRDAVLPLFRLSCFFCAALRCTPGIAPWGYMVDCCSVPIIALGDRSFHCAPRVSILPALLSCLLRQVKVGRYFLEQLIADLDSSKESSSTIRQRLSNPTALGDFLQLCHLRLLHERDVSCVPLTVERPVVLCRKRACLSVCDSKVLSCLALSRLVFKRC